jgi:CHAT domain-containing protein
MPAGHIRPVLAAFLCLCAGLATGDSGAPGTSGRAHAQAAEVLQLQGQHEQAIPEYRLALAEAGETDPAWRALLLAQLGGALLTTGRLDEAETALNGGLEIAGTLGDAALLASLLNNQAHLLRARGDINGALSRFREAFLHARRAGNPSLQAKSSLSAAEIQLSQEQDGGNTGILLEKAWQATASLPPSRNRAWLELKNAMLLQQLAKEGSREASANLEAAQRLEAAARTAEAVGDARTGSHAHGLLGALYEQEQRYKEALALTTTAVFLAQQVRAPELRYRWEWQQGRINAALGRPLQALEDHRRAAASLQSLRAEFAAENETVSAGLREDATPLFLALADLLLRASEMAGEGGRQQALLREARETVELLKATELQDYFQDDCVAAVRERIQELDTTIQPGTAVLYPIALPDRLELLLSLHDGIRKFSVPVGNDALVSEVYRFRQLLEKRTTRQYLRQARQLYQWLIAPLEAELVQHGIDTLVVVPGPALRAVPVSALHDGEDFLIRRYAVAMTPSLRLTDPRPIRRENVSLLLNGLTESVQGFPPLVHVASELDAIRDLYGGTMYRDQGYRKAVVQEELANEQYSIVHFATHGQFSGKVRDSFILTYDGRIGMDDLEEYIGVSWFRGDRPVELLALSACETAAGDNTAALGLASVAIKAGARSALASLWSINDQASSELVSAFYAQLRDPDVSKAQALRLAQVDFLEDMRYRHPAYWAPFLLIGNWL